MKKFLVSLHRIARNTLATTALALGAPSFAQSNYGCEVLLCLSNPAGPTAVSQCVPPINRLWDDLRNFRGFPTCAMAGNPSTGVGSYATHKTTYYDECPAGMSPLTEGSLGISVANPTNIVRGIGTGDGITQQQYTDADSGQTYSLPSKACVGNYVGSSYVQTGPDSADMVLVNQYSSITYLFPQVSPNVIDIFINASPYRRIRW